MAIIQLFLLYFELWIQVQVWQKVLKIPLMYLHHPELGSSLEILGCLVWKNIHKQG